MANSALAAFYLATHRAPEAERYLRAAAEADSDPAAPLKLALADYYVSQNRVDAATTLLTQLAKNRATGTAARTRLAVLAYEHSGHTEGHRAIDAVLATAPRNVAALLVKARFLLQDGKTGDALVRVRTAIGVDPSSVQAHYLLGSIHRLRGDIGLAMTAFNDVLRLNPRVVAAQVELARLNLASGRADVALQYSERAARDMPDDADVQLTLARSLLANGQVRRAEPILRTLVSRAPQSAAPLATLGMLQARNNDRVRGAEVVCARAGDRPIQLGCPGRHRVARHRGETARGGAARADALLEKMPKSAPALVLPPGFTARPATGHAPKNS